jgi:hypothetical protein
MLVLPEALVPGAGPNKAEREQLEFEARYYQMGPLLGVLAACHDLAACRYTVDAAMLVTGLGQLVALTDVVIEEGVGFGIAELGGAGSETISLTGLKGASVAVAAKAASALGDLTAAEAKAIQDVVNQAGRPLEVVGSAARGARTAASDIDYVVPPSSWKYFEGLEGKLPGLDPSHGIIPGVGNPNIGPVLRFEPTTFP